MIFFNEGKTVTLTFNGLNDNGDITYKGSDGKVYVSVEGVIHSTTKQGEAERPAQNVKVKKGEVIYNPKDRFNRNLNTFQE